METISELEAHQRAYLQIFRAVLKKKNATPDQARVLMAKLQQYITARIKTPDEFLDHIPAFAKGLAVKPEALSAFIGSNLLPALETVKKQMREAAPPPEPAGPSISEEEVTHSIFKEIERDFGPLAREHMRFNGEDMGLLRLVSLNGGQDIPSTSLQGALGGATPAPTAASGVVAAAASGGSPAVSVAGAGASAPEVAAPSPIAVREKSIIADILEQFGEELTVTGPLHVAQFPREAGAAVVPAAGAAPGAPAAGTAPGSPAAAASTGDTPALASAPPGMEQEPSIIGEILERFAEELTVTGPLVLRPEAGGPPVGRPGAAGATAMPGAGTASAGGSAAAAPEPTLVQHPEVPLTFQQYVEAVRQIQEFQSKGDQVGYRNWLNGDAGQGGKALVGLRNIDAKARKGGAIHWDDEYYNIASHMNLAAEQIRSLHERIKRFQQLQQLLNQFIGGVKVREPAIVGAVKKIWPQVRLLFNDEWSADAMMGRLKIPLLQITDPALKQQVQELMLPLLQKAESLAKGS